MPVAPRVSAPPRDQLLHSSRRTGATAPSIGTIAFFLCPHPGLRPCARNDMVPHSALRRAHPRAYYALTRI